MSTRPLKKPSPAFRRPSSSMVKIWSSERLSRVLAKPLHVFKGRFGVADGRNDITFRGEVFGQIGHHEARARIAVRQHDERVRRAGRVRRCVAGGAAPEFKGDVRALRVVGSVAEHVAINRSLLFRVGHGGGVEHFQGKGAVVARVGAFFGDCQTRRAGRG